MDLIDEIMRHAGKKGFRPLKADELRKDMEMLNIAKPEFDAAVDVLLNDGTLFRSKSGKLGIPEKMGVVHCILKMNERGYGFCEAIKKTDGSREIYIPDEGINGAMHGDRVMVKALQGTGSGRRVEGKVEYVVQRSNDTVVGAYAEGKDSGTVIPDNKKITGDIIITGKNRNKAKNKDKVVVKIIRWPEDRKKAEGEVIEILGNADEPGVDILSIIREYRIDTDFPEEALKEADRLNKSIPDDESASRIDYRSLQTITVDGEDAKDLDDAVSVSRMNDGTFALYVHIADVSHYITEGSGLDREARKRGTSVYLVDRTIPMLPPGISNDICSLNAGEDRLTFTCRMCINGEGEIVDRSFDNSIINVDRRFTYDEISDYLEGAGEHAGTQMGAYKDMIADMADLTRILKTKRENRGSIEFDFDETKILIDESGTPVSIQRKKRNFAESIIEEFMIAANETVAENFEQAGIPFIYRIHEPPSTDKLKELSRFIAVFGYRLRNINKCRPADIRNVLKRAAGKKEEKLINMITLRTQQKARYSENNAGHFGLASACYTHFTSPIRRYPDLYIHRIIKTYLAGGMDQKTSGYYAEQTAEAARTSSMMEQRAEEAERDSEDLKKAEYMRRHIGETFTGNISNVLKFGLFVELDNTVEGFVKISDLTDDYYNFDERLLSLVGERTSRRYGIGDRIEVIVVNASIERRQIDFEIASNIKPYGKKQESRLKKGNMKQYRKERV